MKNHLLIYNSILLLAGLCYNGYADPQVKIYDQVPTKEQLLADLKPSTKTFRLRNMLSSTDTCRSPDFKAKTVGIAVQFQFDSFRLTEDARKFADRLGEALSTDDLRDCHFEIEGHTDSYGSEAYNKELSKKRANAVTTYLVNQHSINPARLKARGYGENRLLSDYSSTSYKQRRVQVKNVGRFK